MERLDDLFDALAELTESRGGTKATSIRQPAALNRAAQVATELGMDESFSAAANRALEERVRAFARQRAFAAHFGLSDPIRGWVDLFSGVLRLPLIAPDWVGVKDRPEGSTAKRP